MLIKLKPLLYSTFKNPISQTQHLPHTKRFNSAITNQHLSQPLCQHCHNVYLLRGIASQRPPAPGQFSLQERRSVGQDVSQDRQSERPNPHYSRQAKVCLLSRARSRAHDTRRPRNKSFATRGEIAERIMTGSAAESGRRPLRTYARTGEWLFHGGFLERGAIRKLEKLRRARLRRWEVWVFFERRFGFDKFGMKGV